MEVYKAEDGRTFIVVDKTFSKEEAVKEANKHFKVKKDELKICEAYVRNDTLFFEASKGKKKVWAIWHERKVS